MTCDRDGEEGDRSYLFTAWLLQRGISYNEIYVSQVLLASRSESRVFHKRPKELRPTVIQDCPRLVIRIFRPQCIGRFDPLRLARRTKAPKENASVFLKSYGDAVARLRAYQWIYDNKVVGNEE